jgi:hypothetical protein
MPSLTITVPAEVTDKARYAVNAAVTRMRSSGMGIQSSDLRAVALGSNTYRVTRGNVCMSY